VAARRRGTGTRHQRLSDVSDYDTETSSSTTAENSNNRLSGLPTAHSDLFCYNAPYKCLFTDLAAYSSLPEPTMVIVDVIL